MQAIQTKYLPMTNSKPSRIKAWCEAGQITISYPHELSGQAVHRKACDALRQKLGWVDRPDLPHKPYAEMVGGSLPSGGYCFVFVNDSGRE